MLRVEKKNNNNNKKLKSKVFSLREQSKIISDEQQQKLQKVQNVKVFYFSSNTPMGLEGN